MAESVDGVANEESVAAVFVSYSRKDIDFVDRLEVALKARGFEPLVDRSEINAFEDWWRRIETLIGRSDTVIFVVSPDGAASQVALREVDYAASLNKRFAPIVCRPTDENTIAEPLRRLNFIFFDDPAQFEARADQLAEALRTDIDWIRQHTDIGVAARRWGFVGRPGPRGLLLRSPALEEAEHWIASRPRGAPAPTEETRAFVAQSRRAATQRRNVLSASLGSGLIVALLLAGLAYWQRGIAIEQREYAGQQREIAIQQREYAGQQRDIAVQQREYAAQQRDGALSTQSRLLAIQAARATDEKDIQTSILLSLEALRGPDDFGPAHSSAEAEKTLLDALYRNPLRAILRAASGKYKSAAFVSGSSKLVTITEDGVPSFWSIDDRGRASGKLDIAVPSKALANVFADPIRPIVVFWAKDGSYFAWNVETAKAVPGVEGSCSSGDATFAFDSGARLLVYCSNVTVFNLDNGQKVQAKGNFEHFAMAPRGGTFAVSTDRKISVIDKVTGAIVASWQQPGPIVDLGMSYDGKAVLCANYDGITFRDAGTGALSRPPLKTSQARTFGIKPSPTANILVADGDDGSQLWNIDRSAPIQSLAGNAVGFLPNGYLLSLNSPKITLWEYPTEGHTGTRFAVDRGDLYVSGGHSFLAGTSNGKAVATLTADGDIYLWSTDPAMLLHATADKGRRLGAPALFSTDGKSIVTTSNSGTVTVWDAATFVETAHVRPDHPPVALALSGDARRLAYVEENEDYDILDVPTLRSLKPPGLPSGAYAVALSSDGETLALGDNQILSFWRLSDGSNVARCTTKGPVGGIAWSDDGSMAYSMDGGAVALLDRDTCLSTEIFSFDADKPKNANLRFKQGLVLAFLANRVQVWSVSESKIILDVTRHEWPVFDESFAESTLFELLPGRRVIVGRQPDGVLTIYDLTTRDQILAFDADTNDCCSPVAISALPSGDRLMTLWSERGAYRLRTWQLFPTLDASLAYAEGIVPECASPETRKKLGLDAIPPRWCITLNKRPYDTVEWRQWLADRDAGKATAPPGQ
jgi:WD40 repeat protein